MGEKVTERYLRIYEMCDILFMASPFYNVRYRSPDIHSEI